MKTKKYYLIGLLVLSGLLISALALSAWLPNSQRGSVSQQSPEDTGTLPLNSSVSIVENSNTSVTINGLTAEVQGIDLNPDWPTVTICTDVPSVADWVPTFSATHNGKTVRVVGWKLRDPDNAIKEQHRCFEAILWSEDFDFQNLSGVLVLSLDYLTISLPERIPVDVIAAANETTKAAQIEFEYREVDHGAYFTITQKPADLSEEEALEIVNKALETIQGKVDGPWVFDIDLN
ncbi:MAG: hypothetical protein M1347_07395 [Chloroflexi bacterium]|nr:hypothetical protein [Chloroflexota bacterium]